MHKCFTKIRPLTRDVETKSTAQRTKWRHEMTEFSWWDETILFFVEHTEPFDEVFQGGRVFVFTDCRVDRQELLETDSII